MKKRLMVLVFILLVADVFSQDEVMVSIPAGFPAMCPCRSGCEDSFFIRGECLEDYCSYTMSQCEFGCSETGCLQKPTPCDCPDFCQGDYFMEGRCVDNQCTYIENWCGFGCSFPGGCILE